MPNTVEIKVKEHRLHVKSKYDTRLVTFMRSISSRTWDAQNKIWIIPEDTLPKLISLVADLGYEYAVEYEEVQEIEPVPIPDWYEFKTTPLTCQEEGIKYALAHPKFLLADEQGIGKTKQVIDTACIRKRLNGVKHVLIITCVNGLKYNWRSEVEKHSNESAYILGTRYTKKGREYIGSNEERLADLKQLGTGSAIDDHYFIITNIETLRYNKTVVKPTKRKRKDGTYIEKKERVFPIMDEINRQIEAGNINMVAADEIHRCRNSAALQGQAILSISCDNMIAITGTPVMNRPIDAYVPLAWLGFETHTYWQFENHYCVKGNFHQIIGYQHLCDLQATLDKCMIRRLKADVLDLPEKIYINDYVEMTPEQIKLYTAILDEQDDIDMSQPQPTKLLAILTRLRQTTGNPSMLSDKIKSNPKYDRMLELLDDVVDNGGKALVYSNWTQVLNPAFELAKKKGFNPALYTGENTKTREQEKDRFKSDPNCKVIFGTIGAMGTGLTLTEANTVIFLDEPWSRAIKDQCEDRVHRIGTVTSPNIITLICKGTIDEAVSNIIYKKGKLSDIVVDKEEDIVHNTALIQRLLEIEKTGIKRG